MYKQQYRLGFISYLFLFILAAVFYKERTIFLDISLALFNIVSTGDFSIQVNRFGVFLTQIFPLLGAKMHLPIQAIMMVYSTGFILFYLISYFLCGHIFKQYRIALVLLLFGILFVTDSFYWMTNEMLQGIALMMVLFAYSTNRETNSVSSIGLGLLYAGWFTVVFLHPIIIIPFLFISIFLLIDKTSLVNKKKI